MTVYTYGLDDLKAKVDDYNEAENYSHRRLMAGISPKGDCIVQTKESGFIIFAADSPDEAYRWLDAWIKLQELE